MTSAPLLRIESYRPEWREHFDRLNAPWITQHFTLEPIDLRLLRDPEGEIIDKGGRVYFALLGRDVVGTCALELQQAGVFELIKMGVEERHRGAGVGRALLAHAIAEFHALRGRELYLETNSKLMPALRLYESMGFVRQAELRPGSAYARSDVHMIYQPDTAAEDVTATRRLRR